MKKTAFEIILHSGKAQTAIKHANTLIREYAFEKAERYIEEAREEIKEAHTHHRELLQSQSEPDDFQVQLLIMHAEDHLMHSQSAIEMSEELFHLYKKIQVIESESM